MRAKYASLIARDALDRGVRRWVNVPVLRTRVSQPVDWCIRRFNDAVGHRRHFDRRDCASRAVEIKVVRTNALILSIDHAGASLDALDDPLRNRL
jgi:hypothetical protein